MAILPTDELELHQLQDHPTCLVTVNVHGVTLNVGPEDFHEGNLRSPI